MIAMVWRRHRVRCSRAVPDRPGSPWRISRRERLLTHRAGSRARTRSGGTPNYRRYEEATPERPTAQNAGEPSLPCGRLQWTRGTDRASMPALAASDRVRSLPDVPCHIAGPSPPRVSLRWPSLLASPVRSHPVVRRCFRLQGRSSRLRHRVRRRRPRHHRPPRRRVMQGPTPA
jgi:hypothetical protein